QDYPFARLVDKVNLKRDLSRPPLVSTVFNLERQLPIPEVEGLHVQILPQASSFARFDLILTANVAGDRLVLECDYNTDLFDAATVQRLLGHYRTLLQAAVAAPEGEMARLPLLTASEQQTQLRTWNDSGPAVPDACVHHMFEAS